MVDVTLMACEELASNVCGVVRSSPGNYHGCY
jgi:hypothetical protein